MAYDGITVAAVTDELNRLCIGGRVMKITQPEKDEIGLQIKNGKDVTKVLISASASLPLVYITDESKKSPITAPAFCMLLRKYMQNAVITRFHQPDFERIIKMEFTHFNEMGDIETLFLVVEIMGKHSNIILINDKNVIIDSIKRIPASVSSVRQVLPGHEYFIPKTSEKYNPMFTDSQEFREKIYEDNATNGTPVYKLIYETYNGISPMIAMAACNMAEVSTDKNVASLSDKEKDELWQAFAAIMNKVKKAEFTPRYFIENNNISEYCAIEIPGYANYVESKSISDLLCQYYSKKEALVRVRQKSSDLRRIVQNALERTSKKYDLQLKQLKDTEKREKYKVYGELITAYGYSVPEGSKSMEALNYYTNENITIPLDPEISPLENAKKYFNKYAKLKRTNEALTELTKTTGDELNQLDMIMTSLDIAPKEEDLVQIKEELMDMGIINRKNGSKKEKVVSKPFHYVDEDGNDYFVGKNNYQNEELSFKIAGPDDWWFHAKKVPGSHVIVKSTKVNEKGELDDKVYERAASLAAYYCKAKNQDKVEVDYTVRRNLKHPNGSAPGFVVYYTNYSLIAIPDISQLKEV